MKKYNFKLIYKKYPHLINDLNYTILSTSNKNKYDKNLMLNIFDTVKKMALSGDDDKKIYFKIRSMVNPDEKKIMISKNIKVYNQLVAFNPERAANRANNVLKLLPKKLNINKVIDIGGSEGSVLVGIGSVLDIPSKNLYVADVTKFPIYDMKTEFVQLDPENTKLSTFDDNSIDLIICLMTLHHIRTYEQVIKEMYRVLKPNGYVIIREHDNNVKGLKHLIDILHGLYALTFSKTIEDEQFVSTYYATYFTQTKWRELFKNNKFELVNTDRYEITYLEEFDYVNFIKPDESKELPWKPYYDIFIK